MKMKIIVAFFVSVVAVGALYAASTIGTNIVTTGTLEVTGTSTLGSVVATNIAGYLKLNQTTSQTITGGAPIFGEGLTVSAGKNLTVGGATLSDSITPGDTTYNFDGEEGHIYNFLREVTMGNTFRMGENFFYFGAGPSGKIWFDDSVGQALIENEDTALATGDIGLISHQKGIYAQLGDKLGVNKFQIKDSDGTEVASINSDGAGTLSQVVVGNNTTTTAGAIRFDGTHFYGYDGSQWKQLDN